MLSPAFQFAFEEIMNNLDIKETVNAKYEKYKI